MSPDATRHSAPRRAATRPAAATRRVAAWPRAAVVFARLPPREQATALWLLAVVAVVEVLVRTRPLPRAARALGVTFAGATRAPAHDLPLELSASERRRVRCARRIARHWPFCQGACLRESLLVGHVLRRHRPHLVVGVDRTAEGTFAAHAWLDVQGRTVGDPSAFQRLG